MEQRIVAALVGALVGILSLLGGEQAVSMRGQDAPYSLAAPPRIILRADGGGEQAGGDGSFCWKNGCVDAIGVEIPEVPLEVSANETLAIDVSALGRAAEAGYAIYPYDAVREEDGETWLRYGGPRPVREGKLAKGKITTFSPDLPPGHYAVEIFVALRRGGDSTQGFNLLVAPAREARTPSASPSPAATPRAPATPGAATPTA